MTAITPTVGARQGINALKNGIQIGGTTITTGDGTPSATMTALRIGDIYVDYTNGVIYIASATGSGSWTTSIGSQRIVGSSATPIAINTANDMGDAIYYSSSATSGTTYGRYCRVSASGIGVEAIGGRDKVILSAIAANAHGNHSTVEVKNTGKVSGLCTGVRGNIVFATDTAVTSGTYYGVMAELFPAGNTSALPTASNACLCCSVPTGTALDLVANAISFDGADGTGKMIYTATDTHQTFVGTIRILVNGVKRYIHFTDDQAATS